MAQKESFFDIRQIISELKETKGLPKNLSTEAQLWDEILKKEIFLMPEQLFSLIREIYGKSYPKHTAVKPLGTEFSVKRADTKEITSIRADVTVLIDSNDIYHFECESKNDKTMVVRMFEYDVHIALSYQSAPLSLTFPYSAVLYLQDNRSIPDTLTCKIHFQDNKTYVYKIPTVKIQTYSLKEIHQKHLSILIPFLPLRFRKLIRSGKSKQNFTKEQLTSFYKQIILILDEEVQNNFLTENNRNVILNLLHKSFVRIFYQDNALLKEVVTMTEPILELEIEKYIRAVEAKTTENNLMKKELEQINETITQKDNEIAVLKKQLQQLQFRV